MRQISHKGNTELFFYTSGLPPSAFLIIVLVAVILENTITFKFNHDIFAGSQLKYNRQKIVFSLEYMKTLCYIRAFEQVT